MMTDSQTVSLIIQPKASVVRDTLANRKWIGAFALCVLLWVTISAIGFHFAEQDQLADGKHVNGIIDSLYFTVINVTTVGFGDITPKSDCGKLLAMANAIFGVLAFGVLVAIISAALQPSDYTATGSARSSESPPKPDRDGAATVTAEGEKDPERRVFLFLRELNALIGEPGRVPSHKHLRINVTEGEPTARNATVDIEIHRWS